MMILPTLLLLAVALGTASMIQSPAKRTVEKRRARDLKTRPQVRTVFPPEADLRALGRSYIKRPIHPLIILPDGTILDGECRFRGVMLENPDHEMDVIAVGQVPTDGEIVELQMISALHSTTLTPHDQAVACKQWMEHHPGASAKLLAEKIDRDPSMVMRLLSLWNTIPEVQKAAEEAKIGPSDWYSMSLASAEQMAGLLAFKLSGASSKELAAQSLKIRNGKEAEAVKASKVKCILPSGVQILVTGDGITLDDSIEALGEAIKEMKRCRDLGYTAKTFAAAMADRAKKGG